MQTSSVPAPERGLAVLESLADARAGLTLPAVSRELRLPKSSVHCLPVTLERHRHLRRNERTSPYTLGSRRFSLGKMSLSGFQVRQAAAPHIHAVTQRTGLLITHLAVLERNKAPLVSETGLTRHDGNSNPARELVTPDAS